MPKSRAHKEQTANYTYKGHKFQEKRDSSGSLQIKVTGPPVTPQEKVQSSLDQNREKMEEIEGFMRQGRWR